MIFSCDEQTIIAQCTPQGSGAIALLRMSGNHAIAIAKKISVLASGQQLDTLATHTIHYGHIIDTDSAHIDQVLFLLMHGPKTFTGQDTVEITCHNNQFIIEKIIRLAIAAGARLAQEGEFSKRAVLNGKIDLIQAEAINELIHAQTQLALKNSLAQLEGSFSHWIASIEKELLKGLALCQASFEFLDDEIEFAPQIQALIQSVHAMITQVKKTFSQQQQIRQGIRIAIIGSVNAGKSSLFNALLNQERAIVTAIAGTTRDTIEAGVYTHNNFWTLIDTAGLRSTDDSIEQEGIKRSMEQAQNADIILLVYECARNLSAQEEKVYEELKSNYAQKIITVYNKSDMVALPIAKAIAISSKTKDNIATLEQAIEEKITHLFTAIESPFLLNQRQYSLLLSLENKLHEMAPLFHTSSVAYELLAIHLTDAIAQLAQLSGKEVSESSMNLIFKEFCIGK